MKSDIYVVTYTFQSECGQYLYKKFSSKDEAIKLKNKLDKMSFDKRTKLFDISMTKATYMTFNYIKFTKPQYKRLTYPI
jgi:hypothetical protein